jgi:hypothetical protein
MASAKSQLEELKKPNPRYVLELHTIRGMIQEADNMDKELKAAFQKTQAHMMAHSGVPSVPQPPPQPPSASTSALFAQSVPPTAPPVTALSGVLSSSIFTLAPTLSQIRHSTREDLISAKRWVEEKKQMMFNSG